MAIVGNHPQYPIQWFKVAKLMGDYNFACWSAYYTVGTIWQDIESWNGCVARKWNLTGRSHYTSPKMEVKIFQSWLWLLEPCVLGDSLLLTQYNHGSNWSLRAQSLSVRRLEWWGRFQFDVTFITVPSSLVVSIELSISLLLQCARV